MRVVLDTSVIPKTDPLMSALTIEIPEAVHAELKRLAASRGEPVDQLLSHWAGRMVAQELELDRIRLEVAAGDVAAAKAFLASIPAAPPAANDEIE
jgi:hypothetical protein